MPKRCRHCNTEIVNPTPWRKPFCSYQCGIQYVRAKQNEKRAEAYRKETRVKKEALKTKPQLLKEAQAEFNKYIRQRDEGLPCISCGKHMDDSMLLTGSKWDCGHYRSVGAMRELRFHPFNAARQCVKCNRNKSGNPADYRINLIKRIGKANVEWLEGPHETQNWTHEDIRDIKQYYKDKIKGLKDEKT